MHSLNTCVANPKLIQEWWKRFLNTLWSNFCFYSITNHIQWVSEWLTLYFLSSPKFLTFPDWQWYIFLKALLNTIKLSNFRNSVLRYTLPLLWWSSAVPDDVCIMLPSNEFKPGEWKHVYSSLHLNKQKGEEMYMATHSLSSFSWEVKRGFPVLLSMILHLVAWVYPHSYQ